MQTPFGRHCTAASWQPEGKARATARCLELLEELGFTHPRLRILLGRHSTAEGRLHARFLTDQLGRPVDFVVPYDKAVLASANKGVPLVLQRTKSEYSEAVRRLVQSLFKTFRDDQREAV